ncbi:MAG: hypothetical protein HQ517_04925 [SAR324 cluster bacterium]|nr:hypothetical protein [SAR324 cluster bacterium]
MYEEQNKPGEYQPGQIRAVAYQFDGISKFIDKDNQIVFKDIDNRFYVIPTEDPFDIKISNFRDQPGFQKHDKFVKFVGSAQRAGGRYIFISSIDVLGDDILSIYKSIRYARSKGQKIYKLVQGKDHTVRLDVMEGFDFLSSSEPKIRKEDLETKEAFESLLIVAMRMITSKMEFDIRGFKRAVVLITPNEFVINLQYLQKYLVIGDEFELIRGIQSIINGHFSKRYAASSRRGMKRKNINNSLPYDKISMILSKLGFRSGKKKQFLGVIDAEIQYDTSTISRKLNRFIKHNGEKLSKINGILKQPSHVNRKVLIDEDFSLVGQDEE